MIAFNRIAAVLYVLLVGGGPLLLQADAQPYHLSPSGVQQVNEGGSFVFNCTVETGSPPIFFIFLNDSALSGRLSLESISGGGRYTFGPVTTSDSGSILRCSAGNVFSVENATLDVTFRPRFSPTTAMVTPTQGEQFTLPFHLSANPPPNINLTRSGTPVTDVRVTVTATSVTIADVTRGDSGEYQITASNVVGSAAFTLTVDVYYPPEFTIPSQNVTRNAARNEVFTFDCTPSGGNPAVYSYTFLKDSVPVTEGVSGSVLTINPVVRNSRGMYSCTANNTAGTAVVTRNLFVVDVPMVPLNPRVVDLMPFSATLQWDPPSDNGGSFLPLTFTVTLTNTSTSLPFFNITATSLPLPHLQHSTQYSWSVKAINEYGISPPAEGTFTTLDSVPVIDSVSAMALSLSAFRVNITLLTDGGQNVSLYTIGIQGVNYTGIVEGSVQSWVSVLVNQLDQNFTKGETHTVRVFATNSIGTSNPLLTLLIVPFPLNITAPPTELSTTNIPVCCAGVQLNLANPDDPSDVRVLIDGTPHPPNQVTRSGSFLYIMGLQAGTEYSLTITLSNIFGTVWVNTTVTPLLGHPSSPQVALTPTAGGLTVQLTVMYPGTREDTLQYSISTSPSPLSRRQTGQQPLPVTDLTTPTSGSAEVALGPGTYSVTVTVTNQHGSTASVPQEVNIPGTPGSGSVETAVIIGLVVAVATVILLIIITVFVIVLVCVKHKSTIIRCCKLSSSYDDVKVELRGLRSNSEDVKLELNPAYGEVTPSQVQTEPQPYEEFVAIGGVTSECVAMEENPAYQTHEPPQYEFVVGVTSNDVQMEENPAYQSVDTTVSQQQTEEPDYL